MNPEKEVEAQIEKLEAEAKRLTRLAQNLRAALKQSAEDAIDKPRFVIKPRQKSLHLNGNGEQKSVRALALELIAEAGTPLHVDQLVEMINKRRHDQTNRAAVESQLVRALKSEKFGIKRTAPGTFGVA